MKRGLVMGALVTGVLAAGALLSPASALSFNFTQIAGDSLTASEAAAFTAAAGAWSAVLSDPISVNVSIGFRSLGSNVLGQTAPLFVFGTTNQVKTALTVDSKSSSDAMAVASLGTLPNVGSIAVTSAEAKALGFVQSGSDGTIEFSTNFGFSDSRDANGNISNGTFDLIGVAEHEIAHLLGFDSSIDGGTGVSSTLLDEFRFSSVNTRATAAGSAYFSLNNGATTIAAFSVGGGGQDQASHWLRGVNALMIPAYNTNQVINITPLDVTALDVIGWDVTVPEPRSLAILMIGLAGLAVARRRV